MLKNSKSLLISGKTGFVGKNWDNFVLKNKINIKTYRIKSSQINNPVDLHSLFDNKNGFLHLCGLAHDLKKTNNPELYYEINTELTKKVFNEFIRSDAKTFIFISSVKAVADFIEEPLNEETIPNPKTHYGKSKLLAEKYIMSQKISNDKRVYILRPCMIHGPNNKGNFNLLFNYLKKGFPWPLGNFKNKRSFCSIENLCFVLKNLFENHNISSGIYNVCDSETISTNEIVRLISKSKGYSNYILKIPKYIIISFFKILDFVNFKINSEQLQKLTKNYIVSNSKLVRKMGPLPVNTVEGLNKTFKTFN